VLGICYGFEIRPLNQFEAIWRAKAVKGAKARKIMPTRCLASMVRSPATEMVGPHLGRIARPSRGGTSRRIGEGILVIITQRRWDNVERGVKLALRCATEVVRLIIELRGVR